MEAIQTAITTWGTSFATDAQSMIATVLPIALGIVGLSAAVMFGIKFFLRLKNKG